MFLKKTKESSISSEMSANIKEMCSIFFYVLDNVEFIDKLAATLSASRNLILQKKIALVITKLEDILTDNKKTA